MIGDGASKLVVAHKKVISGLMKEFQWDKKIMYKCKAHNQTCYVNNYC
jgi:hypothetical protein